METHGKENGAIISKALPSAKYCCISFAAGYYSNNGHNEFAATGNGHNEFAAPGPPVACSRKSVCHQIRSKIDGKWLTAASRWI